MKPKAGIGALGLGTVDSSSPVLDLASVFSVVLPAVCIFDVLCFLWAGCAVVCQRGRSAHAIVDYTDGEKLLQDNPSTVIRFIALSLSVGTDAETRLPKRVERTF